MAERKPERIVMAPPFKEPKNQEEFEKRAEAVTAAAAKQMVNTLMKQRAAMVRPIDNEIRYYQKVMELKQGNKVEYQPRGSK